MQKICTDYKEPDPQDYDYSSLVWEEYLDISFEPCKETMNIVPVPYTTMHYQPNVRRKSINTNDLGYRGIINLQ
jgi:hypothetical protein